MKKIISLVSILSFSLVLISFISPEFAVDSVTKHQDYKLILGEFKLNELKATTNKTWFNSGYENYTPKPEVLEKITSELKKNNFHISVYMGTWCPDSRREFPRLIKILNQVNFKHKRLSLVGVDRDKLVPNVTEEEREKLNILNVPTIIVYDDKGNEINRFVEFAQETLEEDLLKILSDEDYKHVYDF